MSDYWQDKRINHAHVVCAWGLVVVVIALMLAIAELTTPDCPQAVAAGFCADDAAMREAKAERPL